MRRTKAVGLLFALTLALAAPFPAAANCPTPNFQELTPSPAGHDVTDWAIGDFDGDGYDDVISVSAATRTVKIGLNDGEGNYVESYSTTTMRTPGTIVTGDFNHDQRLDFVVSQEKSGAEDTCTLCGRFVPFVQQAIAFTFTEGTTYVLPYAAAIKKMAVADFNDDGHLDLAIAAPPVAGATQNLNVANGTGSGTFSTVSSWTIDGTISDVVAGDFANPAGLPDLVIAHGPGANSTKSRVSTLVNQTGTFDGTYTSFNLGSTGETMHLDTGHYNSNTWLDVAVSVTGYTTAQVQVPLNGAQVLLANGSGGFISGGGFFTSDTPVPTDVAAVDLTQDGKLDLAFTVGSSIWYYMIGTGNGLGNQQGFTTRTTTVPVAGIDGTDFDRDGRPDLLFFDTPDDLYLPAHNACFYHYDDLALTKSPEGISTYGDPVTLIATLLLYPDAPMPQQGAVAFYDGNTLLATVPLNGNGTASYTYTSLALGDHTLKAVFNAGPGEPYRGVEKTIHHHVQPPPFGAPLFVTATGNSGNNTITITWTSTQDVGQNEVLRLTNGQWVPIGQTPGNTMTDTNVSANQVYVYTVRSYKIGTHETSPYGNLDVATTASTAIPLDRTIRASHINELRTLINSLRAAAGMSAFAFTDPTLTAGMRIKAVHMNELRIALEQVRTALGLGPVSYTQPGITAGVTKVLMADIQDIKAALS